MKSLLAALLFVCVTVLPVAAQDMVYRIPITGVIELGLAPFVARAVGEAEAAGAVAIILDLDTPGGRIDAAEQIADAVRRTDLPVYAFVNPRAYSAGALIALASDGIYMRSGAVIGAATPVDGQGTKASEKIVSAMRAEFRALAEEHGLDPTVAEAMVDESIAIPGVVEEGQLLTLSTEEAVELGFARAQVSDEADLLTRVGLAEAVVVQPGINWAERLVRFLTSPLVQPLLLSLGMLGLVFEIKSGGFGLGGVVSLGALGLFFGSNLLLGLAGMEEILLLAAAMVALGVEVFVLPGFGVAGRGLRPGHGGQRPHHGGLHPGDRRGRSQRGDYRCRGIRLAAAPPVEQPVQGPAVEEGTRQGDRFRLGAGTQRLGRFGGHGAHRPPAGGHDRHW